MMYGRDKIYKQLENMLIRAPIAIWTNCGWSTRECQRFHWGSHRCTWEDSKGGTWQRESTNDSHWENSIWKGGVRDPDMFK